MKLFSFLLLIAILGVAASAVARIGVSPFADESLVVGARVIVTGQVDSVKSLADESGERVFTYSSVRLDQVLKGDIAGREIVLKAEGGDTPTIGSRIFGTPRFEVGERVLVVLDTWPDGSLRTYQMFLGKLSIERDASSGRDFVTRDAADAEGSMLTREASSKLRGWSPVELSAYVSDLRSSIAINARRSAEFAASHYTSTPIVARPLEYELETTTAGISRIRGEP